MLEEAALGSEWAAGARLGELVEGKSKEGANPGSYFFSFHES